MAREAGSIALPIPDVTTVCHAVALVQNSPNIVPRQWMLTANRKAGPDSRRHATMPAPTFPPSRSISIFPSSKSLNPGRFRD